MTEFPKNIFLYDIDRQYGRAFGKDGARIGSILRIRLPADFTVTNGPALLSNATAVVPELKLSVPEAVAIGAAVVIAKNPTVSRRFWSWLK